MKVVLKITLAALLMPCISGANPQKQKSTRIVFTESQVPQFIAIEHKGKTYVVIDSNRPKISIESKKQ